jgi:hypothetical protein
MSTFINSTIDGIIYANVELVDTTLQPYCPLEHTQYEDHCKNIYHNVTLRPDTPCEHSTECFNLRATLNGQKLDH